MVVFDDVASDEKLKVFDHGASYEAVSESARGADFARVSSTDPRRRHHRPEGSGHRATQGADAPISPSAAAQARDLRRMGPPVVG